MQRLTILSICGWLVLGLAAAWCRADGGAVRALEKDGPFQIAAFTSPNPLTAGTVDLSVLVQDAETLAPLPEADVVVAITPRGRAYGTIERAATAEAATNKLFRACLVELEAGWYDVAVTCRTQRGNGQIAFAMEVGQRPPQLATLWPWIAWPVLPIVLFGVHEVLAAGRPGSRRVRPNATRHGGPGRLQ